MGRRKRTIIERAVDPIMEVNHVFVSWGFLFAPTLAVSVRGVREDGFV